jgi:hypothetical protein
MYIDVLGEGEISQGICRTDSTIYVVWAGAGRS